MIVHRENVYNNRDNHHFDDFCWIFVYRTLGERLYIKNTLQKGAKLDLKGFFAKLLKYFCDVCFCRYCQNIIDTVNMREQ